MINHRPLSRFNFLIKLVILSIELFVGKCINLRGKKSYFEIEKILRDNNNIPFNKGEEKIRKLETSDSIETKGEGSSDSCGLCQNGICETIAFHWDGQDYNFNLCVPCPAGFSVSNNIFGKKECVMIDISRSSKSLFPTFSSDDEWLGYSIANAGDINGDGIDDFVFGSPGKSDDPNLDAYRGAAYVIFGERDSGAPISYPNQLNGKNGFVITGEHMNDRLGQSVSGAGDVNGDGVDDLIIGAPGADTYSRNSDGTSSFHGDSGVAYVIFGSSYNDFPSEINVADLKSGTGLKLHGKYMADSFGKSVSYAGDINGDDIDDIVVGAPRAGPVSNGEAYIFFGSKDIGDEFEIYAKDLNGINGFFVQGIRETDNLGESVSYAGDVNGDGIDDLIIGAPSSSGQNQEISTGAAHIIFGAISFEANLELSDFDGINNGFSIQGINAYDHFGHSVSMAGDLNNDGYADIIMSSTRHSSPGSMLGGEAYIIYGSSQMVSTVSAENADIILTGASFLDKLGSMVAYAGDVNNDGIDDVAITASYAANDSAMLYVLYGASSMDSRQIKANELESSGAGLEIALLGNDNKNGDRITVSSNGKGGGLIVGIPNLKIKDVNDKIGEIQFLTDISDEIIKGKR